MLHIQVHTMLRLRGITEPYRWMRQVGIAPGTARKVLSGVHRTISLDVLEILCEKLRCTPNELIEWQAPDGRAAADHPLQDLRPDGSRHDLHNLVENLSHMSVAELRKLSRNAQEPPEEKAG